MRCSGGDIVLSISNWTSTVRHGARHCVVSKINELETLIWSNWLLIRKCNFSYKSVWISMLLTTREVIFHWNSLLYNCPSPYYHLTSSYCPSHSFTCCYITFARALLVFLACITWVFVDVCTAPHPLSFKFAFTSCGWRWEAAGIIRVYYIIRLMDRKNRWSSRPEILQNWLGMVVCAEEAQCSQHEQKGADNIGKSAPSTTAAIFAAGKPRGIIQRHVGAGVSTGQCAGIEFVSIGQCVGIDFILGCVSASSSKIELSGFEWTSPHDGSK